MNSASTHARTRAHAHTRTHTRTHTHTHTRARPYIITSVHPSIALSVLNGCVIALTTSSCSRCLAVLLWFIAELPDTLCLPGTTFFSHGVVITCLVGETLVSHVSDSRGAQASLWWSTPSRHFLGRDAGEAALEPVCGQVCLQSPSHLTDWDLGGRWLEVIVL